MHPEPMPRAPAQPGNVGDVLASIRRLIALDGQGPEAADNCPAAPLVLSQTHQIEPDPFRGDTLTAEEEAEFAEAEAALARMLALPPIPEPVPAETEILDPPAGTAELPNLFLRVEEDRNEGTLRTLVREALRLELEGEMGATFSRNLQTVIRQEIESVIHEMIAER